MEKDEVCISVWPELLAIYSLSVCVYSHPVILLRHTVFSNDLGSTVLFSS